MFLRGSVNRNIGTGRVKEFDSGDCFAGDFQRRDYATEPDDWKTMMKRELKRIYYAHGPIEEVQE